MLEKHAIEETTPSGHGFLSTIFLVPKKDGGQRPANKSEVLKQVCLLRALQNGWYTQRGPKGRILHGANSRGGQSFPQVLVQREDIPIQMPTFRPSMCAHGSSPRS